MRCDHENGGSGGVLDVREERMREKALGDEAQCAALGGYDDVPHGEERCARGGGDANAKNFAVRLRTCAGTNCASLPGTSVAPDTRRGCCPMPVCS